MTISSDAVWAATYAAVFSQMVLQHMRDGKGAPEGSDYDWFAEEAETIASEASARSPVNPKD